MEQKDKIEELVENETQETTEKQEETVVEMSPEEQLEHENHELKLQVAELKDKFLRLHAEFDNFRKRNVKERLDLMKTASRDTLSALLPVLDDFDRAKKNADEGLSEGIQLVYNKLFTVLEQKGLKPMDSDGELFDPELHAAFTEIPAPNEEMKGKIVDTIERGYYLNDKIIRHAKVVVGK